MAALRPLWASLITSLVPWRPRAFRPRRKSVLKVSASDGPSAGPMISRRPSALAGELANAIIAATLTILPALADLQVGRVQPECANATPMVRETLANGHSPVSGRFRNSFLAA